MEDNNSVQWEWAIGHYQGPQAQKVRDHLEHGVGYFKRSITGKNINTLQVEVAFRRPLDGPRPEHLLPATAQQAAKLDQLYRQRHSIEAERPLTVQGHSSGNEIASLIKKSGGLRAYYDNLRANKLSQQ